MNENPQDPQSNDNTQGRKLSRRRLIHILATGGAITSAKLLPDRWIKPAVDTVFLPAHAGVSPEKITPENFPEQFPDIAPGLLPDVSPEEARRFIEGLSEEELNEIKSQLSEEEVQQLEEFLAE